MRQRLKAILQFFKRLVLHNPTGFSAMSFSTSDLILQIRNYQDQHSILKEKSHHFVFDCPLNPSFTEKPDFVWMGLNPGRDEDNWEKTKGKNDEETRDRDFQDLYGRSENSKDRLRDIKKFLGETTFDRTTHTELFFWCSNNIDKDFKARYGTSFNSSPHLEFCISINL